MSERQDWLQKFCNAIVVGWGPFLLLWVIAGGYMGLYAPPFSEVAVYGEFDFLPQDVPSRQAEELYRQAFDKDLLRSLLVVCLRRTTRAEGLTANSDFGEQDRDRKSDYDFIDNDLRPALQNILKTFELGEHANGQIPSEATPFADSAVTTFSDKLLGPLLISRDKKASLVFVELPNDFMDVRNAYLLDEIESLLYENAEFRSIIPPGLEITLGGTATVGRDMNRAALDSAKATEKVTIIMVISLLLLIYRAPLLAFTPLLTVVLVMHVTLGTIAYLASWQIMGTFQAMDIYILVVVYGGSGLLPVPDRPLSRGTRKGRSLRSGRLQFAAVHADTPDLHAGTSVIGIGMMIFTSTASFRRSDREFPGTGDCLAR
ncbi:MAG: MMPL family transporter [Planctomycetaceae bacterium]